MAVTLRTEQVAQATSPVVSIRGSRDDVEIFIYGGNPLDYDKVVELRETITVWLNAIEANDDED